MRRDGVLATMPGDEGDAMAADTSLRDRIRRRTERRVDACRRQVFQARKAIQAGASDQGKDEAHA